MDQVDKKINENIQRKIFSASTKEKLRELKKEIFGKHGIITKMLQVAIALNDHQKKETINSINQLKENLLLQIARKEKEIAEKELGQKLLAEQIDVTLEGKKFPVAYLHPITQIIQKIYSLLIPFGYQIVESSEIEKEKYNFDKLNMPPEHPARNMQDTFYFSPPWLLRTHTSNAEIHAMENSPNQEIKIITAGKVYRRDEDDATHSHQFTQIEGLVIGKDISFSHLKGILELILQGLFGPNHPIRFRPSYFPFTEPSVEVDAQCLKCQGQGCSICKQTG